MYVRIILGSVKEAGQLAFRKELPKDTRFTACFRVMSVCKFRHNHFGLEDRILVLIVPVSLICFLFLL